MQDLILYLGMAAIGYILASRVRQHREKFRWTGKVQTAAIIILVFTMGARMGSNSEVIENLTSIGLYAFIFTVVVMATCVIFITLSRKLVRVNRYGGIGEIDAEDINKGSRDTGKGGFDKMTFIIIIAVAVGMASGYLFVDRLFDDYGTFDSLAGLAIKVGLCIMLFFVGFDLGIEGTVFKNMRKMGLRVFVFPAATIVGSLLAAGICSIILPLGMRESLAIGAGFGWYSLAPGIILESGLVTASAISFMHNVMRELFGIIFIPIVAQKIGYVECICLPGAAAMDVCLPIVEKYTNGNVAVYSFISGLIVSLAVPVLVPIMLG